MTFTVCLKYFYHCMTIMRKEHVSRMNKNHNQTYNVLYKQKIVPSKIKI